MIRRVISSIVPILLMLGVAELGLRLLVVVGRSTYPRTLANALDVDAPLASEAWAYRFRRAQASGQALVEQPMYRVHPTRGWTTAPNMAVWVDEYLYTTNAHGQRGPGTPSPDTAKTKVMILGDSQTFGDEVDDSFTWPNILARNRPDLELINLAVSGYGLDQMYVTFLEELDVWKPNIVVIAPIRDDFYRTALWFRDYSKPWFEPGPSSGGRVELIHHPPITDPDALMRMVDGMPTVTARRLRLASLFLGAFDTVWAVPRNWRRAATVTTELTSRMLERCRAAGIPLVLALIGNFRSSDRPQDATDPGERIHRQTCETLVPAGLSCPDWRQIVVRPGLSSQGHYKRLGNEMIAELVERGLAPHMPAVAARRTSERRPGATAP